MLSNVPALPFLGVVLSMTMFLMLSLYLLPLRRLPAIGTATAASSSSVDLKMLKGRRGVINIVLVALSVLEGRSQACRRRRKQGPEGMGKVYLSPNTPTRF